MRFGRIELGIGLGAYVFVILIMSITILCYRNFCILDCVSFTSVLLVFTLILVLWVPIDATVENRKIAVRYIARKVVIGNIHDVREVRILDKVKLGPIAFGNRGFFGWDAIVEVKGIGLCHMKACRRHNVVYIEFKDGRRYILSPKDPEKFIEQIHQHVQPSLELYCF